MPHDDQPAAPAALVAAKAKRALNAGRTWSAERWRTFRAESPYLQGRVALVGAYVVVALLTLALVPPRSDPWHVRQVRLDWGIGFKTAIEFENVRDGNVGSVVVEVHGQTVEFDGRKRDGTWRTHPVPVAEGQPVRITSDDLFDDNGGHPEAALLIDDVRIIDDHTRERWRAQPRPEP
jgi:hypothetical protein